MSVRLPAVQCDSIAGRCCCSQPDEFYVYAWFSFFRRAPKHGCLVYLIAVLKSRTLETHCCKIPNEAAVQSALNDERMAADKFQE